MLDYENVDLNTIIEHFLEQVFLRVHPKKNHLFLDNNRLFQVV